LPKTFVTSQMLELQHNFTTYYQANYFDMPVIASQKWRVFSNNSLISNENGKKSHKHAILEKVAVGHTYSGKGQLCYW